VNGQPLVSVIVPNYNKSAFIAEAIGSVVRQTLPDFELIVVDDCSSDTSLDKARTLQSADPRIRILEHSRRRGPGAARNTGIRAAKGRIVALLDSDDVYSPVWLELAVQRIDSEHQECVAYGDWWLMDSAGRNRGWKRGHTKASGYLFSNFLLKSLDINSLLVAPRSCFLDVDLYDESIGWGEDYDMTLRLARRFPFVYVDEQVYGYRLHSGNSWRTFSEKELYRHKAKILHRHLKQGRGLLSADEASRVEARLAGYCGRAGIRRDMTRPLRPLVLTYLRAFLKLSPTRARKPSDAPEPGGLNTELAAREK